MPNIWNTKLHNGPWYYDTMVSKSNVTIVTVTKLVNDVALVVVRTSAVSCEFLHFHLYPLFSEKDRRDRNPGRRWYTSGFWATLGSSAGSTPSRDQARSRCNHATSLTYADFSMGAARGAALPTGITLLRSLYSEGQWLDIQGFRNFAGALIDTKSHATNSLQKFHLWRCTCDSTLSVIPNTRNNCWGSKQKTSLTESIALFESSRFVATVG